MELAMIGLGKMGANMAKRLLEGGHRVVGYDPQGEAVKDHEEAGALGPGSRQKRFRHNNTPAPFGLWYHTGK